MQTHHLHVNTTLPKSLSGVPWLIGGDDHGVKPARRERPGEPERLVVRTTENWEMNDVQDFH
jgi:hypothetical protein